MTASDLVIRNGVIVTSADMQTADIAVTDGRITAIGKDLPSGHETIDATGLWVLPGGVDSHVHVDQPLSSGAEIADDFASGTASALAGGTTTLIGFAVQKQGSALRGAVEEMMARGTRSRCDFAFHIQVTDASDAALAELGPLAEEGHRSVKIFMTGGNRLDDAACLRTLAAAKSNDMLCCIHAENHDLIAYLTEALLRQGNTAPAATALARPEIGEREAAHRILTLAEALDAPLQIFHVSGEATAAEIAAARHRGVRAWSETCTQYLVFTEEDFDRPGMEGAKFLFSPCPRGPDAREALWARIRDHTIETITSDHSPTSFGGEKGKLHAGENAPFNKVPNGIPGLAARLPIVFNEGVTKGRIDPMRFVDLVSTAPAKLFGLWPQKGTLAVGSDADIVLWDPKKQRILTNEMQQHGVDYTPYEGMETTGAPIAVWLRGIRAWEAGEVLAAPGTGRFQPRAPFPKAAVPRHPAGFDPLA
ncbi:dihydropyrimidinase [Thioclava kandeliae]|uniref:Dihydropyrimidinase n=1 Tax=Thioclava kandeliae TaxID=3070818 RepID=A0ABV1SL35_9RHOB